MNTISEADTQLIRPGLSTPALSGQFPTAGQIDGRQYLT